MNLEFIGDLCVITMRNDIKIEELTRRFKNDMRNLMNFDPITRKSPKYSL